MERTFNLPQYKPVTYKKNPETGYYTKTIEQPLKTSVMRLPYELRVTPTQVEKIKCNARDLIISREKTIKGSYKFVTGLQDTHFKNWYVRNDYEFLNGEKVLSIVVFHFKLNNSFLTVYYFPRFDKENTALRLRFVNSAIPHIINSEGL